MQILNIHYMGFIEIISNNSKTLAPSFRETTEVNKLSNEVNKSYLKSTTVLRGDMELKKLMRFTL